MYTVLRGELTTTGGGYDHIEDAMNVAANEAKTSPDVVTVVVDTDDNGAVLVIHNGYAYLADAAPPVEG